MESASHDYVGNDHLDTGMFDKHNRQHVLVDPACVCRETITAY